MIPLALALALASAQAPLDFPSEVEAVYVDAFVTEGDRAVADLGAEDFLVKDNGVRQDVEVVDRTTLPTTAVLALDVSSSVAGEKLAHLKAAARLFVGGLDSRDEVALVTFNQNTALVCPPTTDRQECLQAIDRVEAGGSTAVIDTLYLCLKKRWGHGRPLVVLFTDGQDSESWLANSAVLQAARESSALLYVVGTHRATASILLWDEGSRPKWIPVAAAESGYAYFLRRVAETTGGASLVAEPDRGLEAAFLSILDATRARYVLRYRPKGGERVGRHRLEIKVRRRGLKVRGRREYVVPAR